MGNGNFNGLDAGLATILVSNYADNHLSTINNDDLLTALRQEESPRDSRSAWFSLETLNGFINAIQSKTAMNCPGASSCLGVRIYFGEYPSADSDLWNTDLMANIPASYAGMHTLLMVPTYQSGKRNIDFDPNFAANGTPMPIDAVCDLLLTTQQPVAGGTPAGGTAGGGATPVNTSGLTMLNHASLAPPPFDEVGTVTGALFMDYVDSLF